MQRVLGRHPSKRRGKRLEEGPIHGPLRRMRPAGSRVPRCSAWVQVAPNQISTPLRCREELHRGFSWRVLNLVEEECEGDWEFQVVHLRPGREEGAQG
jgi:hypothetical protein